MVSNFEKKYKISIHALREEGDPHGLQLRKKVQDFYPRPPRGGRLDNGLIYFQEVTISIHALREEGDRPMFCSSWASTRFLSTPSARRATGQTIQDPRWEDDFYPRPPRGGRQVIAFSYAILQEFLSTPSARRATDYKDA